MNATVKYWVIVMSGLPGNVQKLINKSGAAKQRGLGIAAIIGTLFQQPSKPRRSDWNRLDGTRKPPKINVTGIDRRPSYAGAWGKVYQFCGVSHWMLLQVWSQSIIGFTETVGNCPTDQRSGKNRDSAESGLLENCSIHQKAWNSRNAYIPGKPIMKTLTEYGIIPISGNVSFWSRVWQRWNMDKTLDSSTHRTLGDAAVILNS